MSDQYLFERWGDEVIAPPETSVQPSKIAFERWGDALTTTETAIDAGQSLLSGIDKGAVLAAGSGGDIRGLLSAGADKLGIPQSVRDAAKKIAMSNPLTLPFAIGPTSEQIDEKVRPILGERHEPKSRVGRYAETVGEFVPGAVGGPGGWLGKVIKYAALPGAASERASEAAKGTSLEKYDPYIRAGTSVVTGGAAGALTRPRTAEQVIRREMPDNMSPAVIQQAETLMNDARLRGVALTWPEAIEQVSPGAGQGLLNAQRLLESSRDTRQQMGEFFSQRPGQVERAARPEFDAIAPPHADPSQIGRQVGRAAGDEVRDVRQTINAAAEPHYQAAETVRIPPADMVRVRALPGYDAARDAVRDNPQLNRYVAHLPDDSVGFLNEVKKVLDQQGRNAGRAINPEQNQQAVTGLRQDARAVRDAGVRASPNEYGMALGLEQFGRDQILAPLMRSPLGQLAKRDLTTQKAIDTLFPASALPGGAQEVGRAVAAVARRSPGNAASLVRAHAEATFNEAIRNLKAGPSQAGGAKFAASLIGNPQQRASLQAAVEALPNGAKTWAGFERFLEIMAATGKRQDIGSRTAFNASDLKDLTGGRVVSEAAKAGVSPSRLVSGLGDVWDRWQLGHNLGGLANILTDPQSGRLLRAIAQRPPGSREAGVLVARLIYMGDTAYDQGREPNSPRH